MDFIEKVNVIYNNWHCMALKMLQVKLLTKLYLRTGWQLFGGFFAIFSPRGGMPLVLSNVKNTHEDIGSILYDGQSRTLPVKN